MINGRVNRHRWNRASEGRPRTAATAARRRPARPGGARRKKPLRAITAWPPALASAGETGASPRLRRQSQPADALVAAGRRRRESRPRHARRPLTRRDRARPQRRRRSPAAVAALRPVLVVGTLDTKGEELRFIRGPHPGGGLRVLLVDVSTCGGPATSRRAGAGDRAQPSSRRRRRVHRRSRRRGRRDGGGLRGLDRGIRATSRHHRRGRLGRRFARRAGHARAADRRAESARLVGRVRQRRALCRAPPTS